MTIARKNCLDIAPLISEKFHIDVIDIPIGIKLKLEGEIDLKDPTIILDPFFDNIHLKAVEKKIKSVEADFCKLGFLNSAGIKSLVKWVINIDRLGVEEQYKLRIIYSPKITWQGVSLTTLAALMPSKISVEKAIII